MPTTEQAVILLKDPLSKETRSERRALLGASAIGITIVRTGLVPSKISALGIDFNQTDQRSLLLAIAGLILYFLVAFLIYAISDFLVWRLVFFEAVEKDREEVYRINRERRSRARKGIPDEDDEVGRDGVRDDYLENHPKRAFPRLRRFFYLVLPIRVSVLRAILEFGLPIVIGLYAVIALIRARL